jgi:hypothetical protein
MESPSVNKLYTKIENPSRRQKRLEEILMLIQHGFSVKEISERVGLANSTVCEYSRELKISRMQRKMLVLKKALNDGVKSLEYLCKTIGAKSPQSVWMICRQFGLNLPDDIKPYRTCPEIDKYIDEEFPPSLSEIGNAIGVSRERVRQYIEYSGQRAEYRRKRSNSYNWAQEKMRKEIYSRLLSVMKSREMQLAKKEGWAAKKAVQYIHKLKRRRSRNCPLQNIIDLLIYYEDARLKKQKISMMELSGLSKIHPASINNIFKSVDIEPMHKRKKFLGNEIKGKIADSSALPISNSDVSYFLNLDCRCINKYAPAKGPKIIYHIGRGNKLTYRVASQIYEAHDIGFNDAEISELFELHEKAVIYAKEHRQEIEPVIVNALNMLYPERRKDKPYIA